MEDVKDHMLELLTRMESAISEYAPHVWGAAQQSGFAQSISAGVMCFIAVALMVACSIFAWKKGGDVTESEYSSRKELTGLAVTSWISLPVSIIVGTIILYNNLYVMLQPEWNAVYALKRLIS